MNRKKTRLTIYSIILAIFIFAFFIFSLNTNTNMTALIEDALSKQYREKEQITIIDTYEISDYILVAFAPIDSEKNGFAVLQKNNNSRYKLLKLVPFEDLTKRAVDIYIDYLDLYTKNQELVSCLVILSKNSELSKIEMDIDGKQICKDIKSNPSMIVFQFPNNYTTLKYKFYDKNGNPLESK